jgi:hypothetical protein
MAANVHRPPRPSVPLDPAALERATKLRVRGGKIVSLSAVLKRAVEIGLGQLETATPDAQRAPAPEAA